MIPSVAGIHHRELKKVQRDDDVFHTTNHVGGRLLICRCSTPVNSIVYDEETKEYEAVSDEEC